MNTPWFDITDPREILARNDEFRAIPSDRRSNPYENLISVDNWRPKVYPFTVPTIYPKRVFVKPCAISQDKYNSEFALRFPEVVDVLTIDDVYVAGGAASSIITGRDCGDIDIFITAGIAPDMNNLWRKVDLICNKLKIALGDCNERMIPGVITMRKIGMYKGRVVQIILRAFPDLSGLLHGFDIPSCAIAFDGKTTYMTELSAWSHMNMVNIVYPKYRSTTYERRLIKYFNRGFALALPDLDMGAMTSVECGIYTALLPHLSVEILQVNGFFIIGNLKLAGTNVPESDYHDIYISEDVEKNSSQIINETIDEYSESGYQDRYNYKYQLTQPNPRFIYCKCNNGPDRSQYIIDVESEPYEGPHIGEPYEGPHIGEPYEGPRLDELTNRSDLFIMLKSMAGLCYSVIGRNISVRVDIQNYFMFTDEEKLYFSKKLATLGNHRYTYARSKELGRFLDGKIQQVMDLYDKLPQKIDWWIIIDPSRQYTVSLNPIIENPRDWYGKYYCEHQTVAAYDIRLNSLMAYLEYDACDVGAGASAAPVFNSECPICTNPVRKNDFNIITLKCGHIYHWAATSGDSCQGFYKWAMDSKTNCMICRKDFTADGDQ